MTTADGSRWIAAIAHLGLPIWGFFLPLLVWATSGQDPFRRAHARQAFAFQIAFLAVWVVLVVLMMSDVLPLSRLLAVAAVAFGLELLQVARALVRRPPLRLVPLDRLLPE